MAERCDLFWYIVLLRCTRKFTPKYTNPSKGSTRNATINRTIVLGSVAPNRVLEFMNGGEDDNIVTAANRALSSPTLLKRSIPIVKELNPRFEIVCIMGPIPNRTQTSIILEKWEKCSRGQYSRTYLGSVLAKDHKLGFAVNIEALLGLEKFNLKTRIVSTTETGTSLEFYHPPEKKKKEKEAKRITNVKEVWIYTMIT